MDPIQAFLDAGQGFPVTLSGGPATPYDPNVETFTPGAQTAQPTVQALIERPEDKDAGYDVAVIIHASSAPAWLDSENVTVTFQGVDYRIGLIAERFYNGVVNGYRLQLSR